MKINTNKMGPNTTEITKLDHLRQILNLLNEEELKQDILLWGEDVSGKITGVTFLEDDYINPSGDGLEPKSLYENDPEYKDESVILRKGAVIFELELKK